MTDSDTAARTIAMVMFSIDHIPFSLNLRHSTETVFRRETFSNRYLWLAYGWIILVLILVPEIGILQNIFNAEPMTRQQWGICFLAALFFLVVGEISKFVLRLLGIGKEESGD